MLITILLAGGLVALFLICDLALDLVETSISLWLLARLRAWWRRR